MRLPFLRSKDPAGGHGRRASAADDTAAVEAARTRARRRLIGAVVLLVAGVIGFPLLFETQPRPLPVDTPIEVQPRDLATAPAPKARALPTLPPRDAGAESPMAAAAAASAAASTPAQAASKAAPAAAPPAPAPRAAAPVVPAPPPAAPASAPRPDDGARARALLAGAPARTEGAAAAEKAGARFVVQVGAYSDAATLREARQRVEKLGLKTYTQVVDTTSGKRTRVRIGPYASRDEADAAAAKIKRAGLPASILAL